MTANMSVQAVFAMDHCLASIDLTGIEAIALHNKVIDSLSKCCTEAVEVTVDGRPVQDNRAKAAAWEIGDAETAHVRACVEKMVNFGKVPGRLAKGYLDLVNAFRPEPPKLDTEVKTAADVKPDQAV